MQGGQSNLYSLLTTYYLSSLAGYLLAVVVDGTAAFCAACAPEKSGRNMASTWRTAKPSSSDCFSRPSSSCALRRGDEPISRRSAPGGDSRDYRSRCSRAHSAYALRTLSLRDRRAMRRRPSCPAFPSRQVVIGAFTVMGAIVAITGFMQTAYSGASTTTVGDLMELDAIAACVIGGVSSEGRTRHGLGRAFRCSHHGQPTQRHDAAGRLSRV